MSKNSRGKSVSVKSLHAAIDELASARRLEELTALGTILMALARMDAEDGSDELELDTAVDGDDEKPARGKKTAGKKSAKEDEADDEDDDDDALDALNDLDDDKPSRGKKKASTKKSDDDEEDEKPARGRRGKKVVEEEDEADELPELPAKWSQKKFETFLDALDECEGEQFGESFEEYSKMGVRELTAAINGYGVSTDFLLNGIKIPAGKEGRQVRTAVFAHSVAKYAYLTELLVGCEYLEDVAAGFDVDTDDFGKGRTRNKKIAEAIVASIYGEEEGDDE